MELLFPKGRKKQPRGMVALFESHQPPRFSGRALAWPADLTPRFTGIFYFFDGMTTRNATVENYFKGEVQIPLSLTLLLSKVLQVWEYERWMPFSQQWFIWCMIRQISIGRFPSC